MNFFTVGDLCKPAREPCADCSHVPSAIGEACWQVANPVHGCSLLVQKVKDDPRGPTESSVLKFLKGMTKM